MKTAIAFLFAAAVLSGCVTEPLPEAPLSAQERASSIRAVIHGLSIGIVDEGWHTGLVLPVQALGPSRLSLRSRFPRAKYLVFGWGDRSFYMAPHPGLATTFSALFPSPSVLYIQGLQGSPRNTFPHAGELHWICVSSEQAHRLALYLNAYLRKRRNGTPVDLGSGPLPNSYFFASVGTYDAFYTCNTWTMDALAFAGLPVSAQGVVFAGQAMSEVRHLANCPRAGTNAVTALPAPK